MPIEHLTELQYSEDRRGPWQLYIYEPSSEYHGGGIWFEARPKYPDEEITTDEAHKRALDAINEGREVRIVDKGDMLVYHAKKGVVLHGATFWKEIEKAA